MIIQKVNKADLGGDTTDPFACIFENTETSLGAGSVDVLLAQYAQFLGQVMSYWAHIEILNNTPSSGTADGFITLSGFEVDLRYPYSPGDPGYDGAIDALVSSAGGFFLPFSGGIDSGDTFTAGRVTLLPGELLFAVAEEVGGPEDLQLAPFIVEVLVRAVGDRASIEVESNTLNFPVYVCKGCMTLGVIAPTFLDCDAASDEFLFFGDPCSGFPINVPVTCCWSGDRLHCPHPSALSK